MLSWEMVSLSVLIASGTVVCVCSSKQSLFPIQPEVMRLCEAPAECNEAPCSSALPHRVFLCLLTQQAKAHMHRHTHTQRNSSCLYFKCLLYCFFLSPFSHVLSCTLSYFFVLWAPSAPPFLLLPLFVTLRFFSALPSQQEFFVIGLSTAH